MGKIKDACISKLDKPEGYSRKGWLNQRFTLKIRVDGMKFHTQRVDETKFRAQRVDKSKTHTPRDCIIVKTFIYKMDASKINGLKQYLSLKIFCRY